MLTRRNTVHPVPQTTPFAKKPITTNPFLSSSSEDLKKSSTLQAEESYDIEHYTIKYKHARFSSNAAATSNTPNPFLHEFEAFASNLIVEDDRIDQWENYTHETNRDESDISSKKRASQKYKTHSCSGSSRRMSLDLFIMKTPFGWSRRRGATRTSPDMKRLSNIGRPISRPEQILRSGFANLVRPSGHTSGSNGEYAVLKSSRYDTEDEFNSNQYKHDEEEANRSSTIRERSFNPFLISDSNSELEHLTEPSNGGYLLERPDKKQQSSSTSESDGNLVKFPAHQPQSVFSDWSIEDCPRLLAFQKKQQEMVQQSWQDQGHKQVFSESKTPLAKSTTDTVLGQYHNMNNTRQQHRHTSIYHRPNTTSPSALSSLISPRRNSMVIGRNMIRQRPVVHSLYEINNSNHYSEVDSRSMGRYYSHETAHVYEDGNSTSYNYTEVHREPNETSQDPGNVNPFNRNSWQSRSLGRHEFQSYAQDFRKNAGLWASRPWAPTASNSSCGSSPLSPLYRSTFPHEREDYQDSQGELDQTVPLLHNIAETQMQPHGREEEVQNKTEYKDEKRNSAYDFGVRHDNDQSYLEDKNDVRFFYNSVDWQETDDIEKNNGQPHPSTTSGNQSSRERLKRRATLAKKKFYKLLKQPQSDANPSKGEEEDEYMELDDPSRSEKSVYSVTSSLRARMRLTPKTKTVLRQVKRRISTAARAVMSGTSRAANNVTPTLRSNTKRKSNTTAHTQPISTCSHYQENGYGYKNLYDPESIAAR
ncbi:hypothetical protein BGZ49_004672 [Haplosporangium sp. Z 27]|nr:hypothetical protein BGZ49_004672 [Haplosporangium sp. Z 27]